MATLPSVQFANRLHRHGIENLAIAAHKAASKVPNLHERTVLLTLASILHEILSWKKNDVRIEPPKIKRKRKVW